MRSQSGKWIISNFWFSSRNSRYESRLTRVWKADYAHISDKLKLQFHLKTHPFFARLRLFRGLIHTGLKEVIPLAATPAFAEHIILLFSEINNDFTLFIS